MVGLVLALMGDTVPVGFQAISRSEILEVPTVVLREIAQDQPDFAWELALEVSGQLETTIDALAEASFGSLRSRLARHLLERMADAEEPIVEATHQELADSIGTVREVVARLLAALREAGLVTTSRGIVAIRSPEGLAALIGQWVPRRK